MRHTGSDIAIIVTNVMPKDMDCFGETMVFGFAVFQK